MTQYDIVQYFQKKIVGLILYKNQKKKFGSR